MAWPKGQPRNKANEVQPDGVETVVTSIDDWISEQEQKAQELGFVIVKASHPDAEDRIYPGKYSGFLVVNGEAKVQLNNGEWI